MFIHLRAYADELHELLRREQEQNVKSTDSDPAVDAYLKANAASSPDHIATEIVLKLLGLEVCADTIVGDQLLRGISGGQKKRVTSGNGSENCAAYHPVVGCSCGIMCAQLLCS